MVVVLRLDNLFWNRLTVKAWKKLAQELSKTCDTFLSRNSREQQTFQFSESGFRIEEVVYFFPS